MTNESRPISTEGICGDGAAILKDGVMQPIEDVIAALNAAELSQPSPGAALNIIFNGPPGPEGGRFIEVETDDGHSVRAGEWSQRPDGHWRLRITTALQPSPVPVAERLPEDHECCPNPRTGKDNWCWGFVQHDAYIHFAGRWRMMKREWLIDEATHWAQWDALPMPGAEVG